MVNKGDQKRKAKFKVGDKIRFKFLSDFTGHELSAVGTIIGTAADLKQKWPEEMGGLQGNEAVYLVKRVDQFGNDFSHVCWEDEIIGKEEEGE